MTKITTTTTTTEEPLANEAADGRETAACGRRGREGQGG